MPKLIPSEEFDKITDVNIKLNILFSYVSDVYCTADKALNKKTEICQEHWKNCDERFDKIEKRKKIDTTISGIMGLVGGGIVWLGKTILGK